MESNIKWTNSNLQKSHKEVCGHFLVIPVDKTKDSKVKCWTIGLVSAINIIH